jgi:hypothetical protein
MLDPFNRTFMHYLACRGMFDVIRTLLDEGRSPLSFSMKVRLLSLRDNSGHSVLDIATLPPAQMRIVTEIVSFMNVANMSVPAVQHDYPRPHPAAGGEGQEVEPRSAGSRPGDTEARECGDGRAHWISGDCPKYTERLSRRKVVVPKIWNSVATREWTSLSELDFRTEFFYPQVGQQEIARFICTKIEI